MKFLAPGALVCALLAWSAWLALRPSTSPRFLDVLGGRVLVNGGQGGEFSASGAALGRWLGGPPGVTTGTVLHLSDGARTFRIGGAAHRPSPGMPLTARPVYRVDLFLSARAFDELLGALRAPSLAPDPVAAAARTLSCPLVPTSLGWRRMLAITAPWWGTMAAVLALAFASERFEAMQTPLGQRVTMGITIAMVVAGVLLTSVLAARRSPARILDVGAQEIRLREARTGRVLLTTSRSAAAVTRATCVARRVRRFGVIEYPMLSIRSPDGGEIAFGVYTPSIAWRDATPRVGNVRYLVGRPDWDALVEALGVRDAMKVAYEPRSG